MFTCLFMRYLFQITCIEYLQRMMLVQELVTGAMVEPRKEVCIGTVKPVLSSHSKRRPKVIFKTDYRLMQVITIAECSKGSILQYFRPSLSYHFSLRSLFCLVLSGRLRQVLLYYYYFRVHPKYSDI